MTAAEPAKSELTRRSRGHIDDPPTNEGTPIIDADDNGAAVFLVGDFYGATERQGAMRGSQCPGVGALAAGGLSAGIGVDGSNSGFGA